MKWDDALDVWGVHGVGGGLGTILTGLFGSVAINGAYRGAAIDGHWASLGLQCLAVLITGTYAFVVTVIILKVIGLFMDLRVPEDVEIAGLDEALHGESAYYQPDSITGKDPAPVPV